MSKGRPPKGAPRKYASADEAMSVKILKETIRRQKKKRMSELTRRVDGYMQAILATESRPLYSGQAVVEERIKYVLGLIYLVDVAVEEAIVFEMNEEDVDDSEEQTTSST